MCIGMKSITRGSLTIQLYYPAIFKGPYNYGINADTRIVFSKDAYWVAFGFCVLGFGLGVSYDNTTT